MNWRNWCRLCGNYESISKLDDIIVEMARKLDIYCDDLRICGDCNNYLYEIIQFQERSKAMELMFLELQTLSNNEYEDELNYEYEKNANNIRSRYGLKVVLDDKMTGLENLFDPNITSALEIKIENEIELPIQETEANVLVDREYIEEETIGDDGSETDELDDSYYKEENEESKSFKEENEEESIGDEFEEKLKKRRSRKSTDDGFEFICHICKQEFSRMSQLSAHCAKHHDCLPEVMCFCGKIISTIKRLQIHKQKHFPEKFEYECTECKMVYKMKSSYINHMKTKHGPQAKKFVCTQCAKCFKDSRTLMAHEKTHLPPDMKMVFPCEICDKKFVSKNSLKSHNNSVHEMTVSFCCETCGKSFSTKSNLKSHLYSHTTEKNVQCDVCSACFKNMDSLRKHKKTHLEKSFECNICHNRYRNRNNLKAHMVVHSEEKPFQCTFCPNQYKRSKDLKCHLNLHTGERPHVCQFCNRSFINGSNCRKHKLKDHPAELAAFEAVHGRGKSAAIALQMMKTS